jgi:hypothetical protein
MEEMKTLQGDQRRPRQVVTSPCTSIAILNAARDKVSTLFDKLDESSRDHYVSLAKEKNLNPVCFYDKHGERMPLNRLQLFIIMHLQEMYNDEVVNNYVMEDKKTFMLDFFGQVGHVHANPTLLAQRIYGNPHPSGYQVTSISAAIKELCYDDEYKGLLLYDAYDIKKKKPIKLLMYDHPLSCGISSEGTTKGKRAIHEGIIQLHEAFVSYTYKKFIICVPLTRKISEFYGWKLPDLHALIFVLLLQKTASLGEFNFKIGIGKLSEYLAIKDVRLRKNYRVKSKIDRAIECAKGIGLLKKEPIIGSAKNGEILYTFHINEGYFPARKAKLVIEEPEMPLVNNDEKNNSINYNEFMFLFNEQMEDKSIPAIKRLTPKRKGLLAEILTEYSKDDIAMVIKKAAASSFLNGGSGGFKASFEWIFKPDNFLKIFEGNFDEE